MTEWHVFRRECGTDGLVSRCSFGRVGATREPRANAFFRATGATLLAVLVLCGGPLFALDESASSGTARHEFIPLTQISPGKAREFLGRLAIGTASQLPGTKALLVTAEPSELQKAIAILDIVDTRTEFDIKELGPASAPQALLSNEQIADAVGGISIGTFTQPPKDKTKMRAILDVHNGSLVAIAPIFQLEDIRVAVELGPDVLRQRKALARPASEGRITETIQATAMADHISEGPVEERKRTPSGGSDSSQKKFVLPKEMQQKLDEMRRRAAELQAQRLSESQPDVRPASVSDVDGQQVSSSLPLGQSDEPAAEPPTADAVPVGAEPQEDLRPEESLEPVAEESVSLQPGQLVPPEPTQETPPAAEPKAVDPNDGAAIFDLTEAAKPSASAYRPPDFANGDRKIDLMLPERLPIIQLVDLVGKYLGLTYIYNPDEIKGEVTLKLNGDLRGSMSIRDLYLLLESVLKFNNFVMTRHKGNVVTIVPAAKAMEADPTLVDPNAPSVDAGDIIITRVFELEHIDTASADNLLQSMRLSVGTVPVADRSMLIVTAYAHRMERVERLLQLVDRPGEPRKFRFRQLRYTMAKTLTEKVKALAEQLENVTVTVAQPQTSTSTRKLPNESDAQYRTRLAQIRAAQAAAARARAAATGRQQAQEPKPGVYLDADERTNRVLMIGVEKQLAIVEDLVEALDVEQQDLRALQLYPMKHVDAEEVAQKLQELGIISRLPETQYDSTRITGRGRTPRQVPGQPRTVPTPTPEVSEATELTQEGLVGEPQVVVVESTNALLVNATPEQHAKITAIIEYVDSEMLLDEIPYKIYPLENSSPAHLAEILESLIQETVEQEREGKIEKTVVSREEKIRIVPDPNTYSLIVYAKKKHHEWISTLIEQLDKRRPQVLIDVTLVEVTKSDAFTYDLNVLANGTDTDLRTQRSDPNSASALDRFVQWGSGTLTAFYGDAQVEALLETMQSKNYGRVLAKPKLLVNDNEAGKIETIDTTYVEVSSAIPVSTGSAGPQSTLVQTSVDFNPYEAGISLDITPHISEGDLLRLDVVLTRSDFLKTPAVGPNKQQPPPNTRSNTVDTKVTLPNSSTVILGGLMKMNQNKGGSKVPLLGDIPIIGGLFRSIDNEDTQSKLYVFVKAEVIRPAETAEHSMRDLEAISERNRMAFERHELEFQRHEDWPGIHPTPVDPPRVLDAE